jgi:hypothetical protein
MRTEGPPSLRPQPLSCPRVSLRLTPERPPNRETSPSASGTGPEQALEAIHPPPSRTARKLHPRLSFPARRHGPAKSSLTTCLRTPAG